MKDDDALPVSTPPSSALLSSLSAGIGKKEISPYSPIVFGRGRYKFWALAAILLLAFWSMLTGTVNLRWSAGNIARSSDDFHSLAAEDLDALDMEEREKLVKHMWDVYTNGKRVALPRFWKDAFVAAYEDLTSEVPEVREAAITEIARMSVHHIENLPAPLHSSSSLGNRDLKLRQG
ncbi:uncharacterized protein [Henckelia pumila]|uniref:uncharacterized protein n=1 Tax=Henckelia pumila TaxID=405737 RepID=UPI003C6E5563